MHIAIIGPATLGLFEQRLDTEFVAPGYPFPMVSELALEYLDMGHRVTVISTSIDINQELCVSRGELSVWLVPSRARARDRALDLFAHEVAGIAGLLRQVDPDVVHAHWTYEFAWAALRSGLKTVVTVHDWAPSILLEQRDAYRAIRLGMQVRVLARATALTAPSQYIARNVRRYYRKPCSVVSNGVRLRHFSHIGRQPSENRLRVGALNVGFNRLKNTETLMVAWKLVRDRIPNSELVLAGPGYGQGESAHEWAKRAGLDGGVTFQGALHPQAVSEWMAGLTMFVHPSREESFGMVLAEAMAAGLPLIAGERSGAVKEIVGKGGLLLDSVEDPVVLARSVSRLYYDDGLRAKLSVEGRLRAVKFDISTVAERYIEILSQVRGRPSSDGCFGKGWTST